MKDNNARTPAENIERYIYQVMRRLSKAERETAQTELRAKIDELLRSRCGENPPENADVEAVLTQLGSPEEYVVKHGNQRYLIGPTIFSQYLFVLKIVIPAVALGMVIVSLIQSFTTSEQGFEIFSTWIGNITSGMLSGAVIVTIIFAVLEWKKIPVKLMGDNWFAELPPVENKNIRISKSECIVGIVFSALFLVLFLAAPEQIAAVVNGQAIPLFNMDIYITLMPLIAVSCVMGILKDTVKLLEGRYTLRLAAGVTVLDAISIAISTAVLSNPIWNESLIILMSKSVDFGDADFLDSFWNAFGQLFLTVVLVGFTIDLITTWCKTLKGLRYS